jgi:hypothetical protein
LVVFRNSVVDLASKASTGYIEDGCGRERARLTRQLAHNCRTFRVLHKAVHWNLRRHVLNVPCTYICALQSEACAPLSQNRFRERRHHHRDAAPRVDLVHQALLYTKLLWALARSLTNSLLLTHDHALISFRRDHLGLARTWWHFTGSVRRVLRCRRSLPHFIRPKKEC